MSFILDALKKSETDRQRQNGPALFEVKVAPPRNGLPLWAVGLAILLAVNLVIVAWVLLRRPAGGEATAAAPPGPAQAANSLQQTSPPATLAIPASPGAQQGRAPPTGPNTVPVGGTAPLTPLGQTAGMTQPVPAPPTSGASPTGSYPQQQPTATNAAPNGANEALAAQANTPGERPNPDDYAPAAEAGPIPPFGNHVARGTTSGVPLYQEAALAPGAHLPNLRLDLHVFAAKPQERFVMINMHKLHEGDSLPEGVRVESITPEGAVLTHDGARFLLTRE
jgi:general secretion pathway protein B